MNCNCTDATAENILLSPCGCCGAQAGESCKHAVGLNAHTHPEKIKFLVKDCPGCKVEGRQPVKLHTPQLKRKGS